MGHGCGPEPTGVAGIVAPERPALAGLVGRLAPALCAGDTVVVVASERYPLVAITLAECLATTDVPNGAVNILTGHKEELVPVLEEGSADQDLLEDSSQRIEEYFRALGYRDAEAPYARDEANGELAVTVDKGTARCL